MLGKWTLCLICLMVAALSACATVSKPFAVEAPKAKVASTAATRGDPYDPWAKVLIRYVDDRGRINYPKLAQNRAELDAFVAWIYQTGPNNQPQLFPTREHAIAYHINAYNALMLYALMEDEIADELNAFRRVQLTSIRRITMGGAQMSLNGYVDDVIRRLGEPRVFFALNGMTRGYPKLPRVPYRPETLDKSLELDAFNFCNDPRNIRIEHATRSVHVSELLLDHSKDFLLNSPSLISYVNQFRDSKIPESYSMVKIPMDHTVNWQTAPPKK